MEELQIKNLYGLPIYIWVGGSEIRGSVLRIEVRPDKDSPYFVALEVDKKGFWCITQYDDDNDWFKIHYYHNIRDLLDAIFLKDFYAIHKVTKRIRGE